LVKSTTLYCFYPFDRSGEKTLHHFQCSIGSNVKIKEFSTDVLKGKILDVTEDGIITIDDINNGKVTTKFDDVLSAATYFQWNK